MIRHTDLFHIFVLPYSHWSTLPSESVPIFQHPDPSRPVASAHSFSEIGRKASWTLSISFIPTSRSKTLCKSADAALHQVHRSDPEGTPVPQAMQRSSLRGPATNVRIAKLTKWFQTQCSRHNQERARQRVRERKIFGVLACTSNTRSHGVKLRVQSGSRSLQHEMNLTETGKCAQRVEKTNTATSSTHLSILLRNGSSAVCVMRHTHHTHTYQRHSCQHSRCCRSIRQCCSIAASLFGLR